jgi:hypothetical protein
MFQGQPESRRARVLRPEEVRELLRGEVDGASLQRYLAAVRADPDWSVFPAVSMPPLWIWQLVYHPTGTIYSMKAERLAGEWWRFLD